MTGLTPPPGSMGPWSGGPTTPRATCLLAPNPGPMTLDGTNTWVLVEPDPRSGARAVVIDPGPDEKGHLEAVEAWLTERDLRLGLVVLTHRHIDHSQGAAALAGRHGVGVRCLDPKYQLGDEGLGDGDVIELDGLELRTLGTPGHSSDSLCFLLPADAALLTGDTILGRGTTVVSHPDGELGPYLDSLRRIRDAAEVSGAQHVLPGHGPHLADPVGVVDFYLAHRAERLEQVRSVAVGLVAAGGVAFTELVALPPIDEDEAVAKMAEAKAAAERGDPPAPDVPDPDPLVEGIVQRVYADVDKIVWPAARRSVRAQVEYLHERGDV